MDNQHEFTGVFIPAHIWLSKELEPSEKMLLGEIEALSKKTGWCSAGRKHFAKWLNCTESNVSYYTSKLEKLGFIEVFRIQGFGSKMRVVSAKFYTDEPVKPIEGGSKRDLRGVVNGVYGGSKLGLPVNTIERQIFLNSNEEKKEKDAALPLFSSSSPENEILEAEKKENGLQTGAPPPPKKDYGSLCPDCHGVGWHIGRNGRETCETCLGNGLNSKKLLSPPFTHVGTIEPQDATVVRLYDNELPAVTIIDGIPATTHAPTEFRRVNIGEEIERLKTDELAKETFTLSRKIPSTLFAEYVEAFAKEVGGTGETYHNLTAFRKHFFNWSGTRYEITQKRQTQTNGKGSTLTRAGGDLSKYQEKQIF